MDNPERCPLTELIKSQCAHCRVPPPLPSFAEAPFDIPGDEEDAVVAIFPAQFEGGRCALCDGYFDCGDMISRTASGEYWCAECTE
jgi:hypothetical protein